MRASRAGFLLALAVLALDALGAQSPTVPAAPQAAPPAFAVEGPDYLASARGSGATEAEAVERARGGALAALFAGLGKDELFAEIFVRNPPLALGFSTREILREGQGYVALVLLRVDDESLGIVARGPYLAAATSLLDRAEAASTEVDALLPGAAGAENEGLLADALARYGQAQDRCEAALALLKPLADPGVFSPKGGRNAPELRLSLEAQRGTALRGLERVRAAEAALAVDEAGAAVSALVEQALAEILRSEALLEESRPMVMDPGSYARDSLVAGRELLDLARRALRDALDGLERGGAGLAPGPSLLRDKLETTRRRVVTADASLASARESLDREIRNPAARRAARARDLRWIFLHESADYLQLRVWLPLELDTEEPELRPNGLLDARLRAEGAFGERAGVWARTSLVRRELLLADRGGRPEETALSQSFDLGFWGRGLFFAGYGWDWLRGVEDVPVDRRSEIRLGFGGVGRSGEGTRRLDWLLGLSWQLPAEPSRFGLWDSVNGGLEAQFRLGPVAVLEGGAEARSRRTASGELDGILDLRAGFGLRLPPPFLLGLEYRGAWAWRLDPEGALEADSGSGGGGLRFYLEYGI